MPDDLKKKRLDRKRIALTQPYEVDYVLGVVRRWIKRFEIDAEMTKKYEDRTAAIELYDKRGWVIEPRTTSLIRCLKLLERMLVNKRRKLERR